MKKEWQPFGELLRAALWNRQADASLFSSHTDWEAILLLARQQTVTGLVGEATMKLPADLQPPTAICTKMRSVVTTNIRMHSLLNRTLAESVRLFTANNIPTVLFKGQGVALNYPEPTLRMCGDIDLYVGAALYDKARAIADTWGEKDEQGMESEKHFHFKHGHVTVELHRIAETLPSPWRNARFRKWTHKHLHDGALRRVMIGGTEVSLPPVQFDVLYIFNHLWHHFSEGGGIGLRQLCDWARYLHTFHKEIDRAALKRDLQAFGLWKVWQTVGYITVHTLGLPMEEFPFYTSRYARQAEKVLAMIQSEGNFGFHDASRTERPAGYMAGKMHTFRRMHIRFGRLMFISPKDTVSAWGRYIYVGVRQVIQDKLLKTGQR